MKHGEHDGVGQVEELQHPQQGGGGGGVLGACAPAGEDEGRRHGEDEGRPTAPRPAWQPAQCQHRDEGAAGAVRPRGGQDDRQLVEGARRERRRDHRQGRQGGEPGHPPILEREDEPRASFEEQEGSEGAVQGEAGGVGVHDGEHHRDEGAA